MASGFARLLRKASGAIRSSVLPTAGKSSERIESRSELSKRYMRELQELIDDRQISTAVARRVIFDLFEPEQPGIAPCVRLAVWRSYLKDRTGNIGPYLVGAEDRVEAVHPEARGPAAD